jgi:hypothetical protein
MVGGLFVAQPPPPLRGVPLGMRGGRCARRALAAAMGLGLVACMAGVLGWRTMHVRHVLETASEAAVCVWHTHSVRYD